MCSKKNWKLMELRDELGLSQEGAADLIGMKHSTYRSKEVGKSEFKGSEMKKVADAFGVSVTEIFFAN